MHAFHSFIHSRDDAPEGDERARRVSSKHSSRSIRFGAVNEVVVRNQTKPINHQSVDATRRFLGRRRVRVCVVVYDTI